MQPLTDSERAQAGFTLTELLVVMVILSLIAAAITPQVLGRLDSSKARAAELQLETLGTSLDMFKIDHGRYPSVDEGLEILIVQPDYGAPWNGPYVKSAKSIVDPWNARFIYNVEGASYSLTSLGADGVAGGDGYDADLIFPDYSLVKTPRS